MKQKSRQENLKLNRFKLCITLCRQARLTGHQKILTLNNISRAGTGGRGFKIVWRFYQAAIYADRKRLLSAAADAAACHTRSL